MKLQGKVLKISGDKTIKVRILNSVYYKKYKLSKIMYRNFLVHDENSEAKINDEVQIISCKPFSKLKTFKLDKINNE